MRRPGNLVTTACAALLATGALGASCGQSALTLMPGVVNDAGNRSLRRAIFSFAQGRLCEEMKGRSLPLAMNEGEPAIGRFYPTSCAVTQLGNDDLFVQFVGHGYAWTNVTGRIGFEAAAAVEYDHDFLVDGSALYVYFRQVQTQSSSFNLLMVERRDGGVAGPAVAFLGGDVNAVAQQVGARVLQSQIARGFTVVREDDGETFFALGVLPKGQKPLVPFDKAGSSGDILVNDRSELHAGQRDYLGPFFVPDAKHALTLTVAVEGAPAVDVLVVPKVTGDVWLAQYERYAATGLPPQPAVVDDAVGAANPAMPPTAPWRRQLPLAPGAYYVVLDNTPTAGRTSPPPASLDDRAALVNYAVQLGDAK